MKTETDDGRENANETSRNKGEKVIENGKQQEEEEGVEGIMGEGEEWGQLLGGTVMGEWDLLSPFGLCQDGHGKGGGRGRGESWHRSG